ncbi:hypothetical protein CGEO_0303 [Campylobacter geochelonis]|nr:hypothetical protein CGEO_0303 [Campylobacter geochelonis]
MFNFNSFHSSCFFCSISGFKRLICIKNHKFESKQNIKFFKKLVFVNFVVYKRQFKYSSKMFYIIYL